MRKIGAFAGFVVALVLIAAQMGWGQEIPRTRTVVQDLETTRYALSTSPGAVYSPMTGVRLAWTSPKGYAPNGSVSWRERTAFPFNDVVLSWNLDLAAMHGARIEIRALKSSGAATAWYEMARVGSTPLPDQRLKEDGDGYIDGDTLVLGELWDSVEYRVTLFTTSPRYTPTLRLMAICYTDMSTRAAYVQVPRSPIKQPWMRSLPVRWRSQMWMADDINWQICGPTSLSMALDYNGCNLPTRQVAMEAFDDYNGIFGNWPFLCQAAARHGFKSWFSRCQDMEPVKREIAAGRPAVIGVRFSDGELSNAPFPATGGHLLLCVGFTPDGDLIINDPGTLDCRFNHVVYKQSEMATVWLSRAGTLIYVVPRKK